jgi:hypothetical protein
MALMAEHKVNWTALAYTGVQDTAFSTDIRFGAPVGVDETEITWAIRRAHQLGMRVCLKPVVNVADGTWRAHIGFFDWDVPGEPSWTDWFTSYTAFILDAARIAEREGCEMLCVGCEMVRADGQDAHWRELIARVREVYTGLITYNCDKYQEDRLSWWDAVDVITSSGYYPIDSWDAELDRIETVVHDLGKPFFFMEAGCPSRVGSPQRPNDWTLAGAPSTHAQLQYYQEMFRACRSREWVGGLMLWDWPAQLYTPEQAETNDDYCPYGKPAAAFMASQYAAWTSGVAQ